MSVAPLITDAKPITTVIPRYPWMEKMAMKYNNGVKYLWDATDMEKKVYLGVLDAMIMELGIFKVYYDPVKKYGGEICVEIVDPRDFFIAPGYDTLWDAPFCGERTKRPYSWVKQHFPHIDKIIPDSDDHSGDDQGLRRSKEKAIKYSDRITFELDTQMVTVYSVFLQDDDAWENLGDEFNITQFEDDPNYRVNGNGKKQKKKYPNGKFVYFTRNQYLGTTPSPYDHGLPPYVELKNYDVPHMFVGMAENRQIDGLNKELNLQFQSLMNYNRIHHNPNYYGDTSSGFPIEGYIETKNEGGKVYPFDGMSNQGRPPITPIEQAPLNESVYQLLTMIPEIVEDVSGVTDVSRGQTGKKERQSAAEVGILYESSHTRTRQRVRNLEWSLKRICYLWIMLMQQYYDEERTIHYKEDGKVFYESIDNTVGGAEKTLRPNQEIMERAEINLNQLSPEERTAYQDYMEFMKKFKDSDAYDPIIWDFEVEIETDSTLPMDKQSRANLALRLYQMKAIDRQSLLKVINWPDKEVIERIRKMEQQAMAAKGGQGGNANARPPAGPAPA
jgi:hypothetical protein